MTQHAKAFPVKSNAARAAKKFGLGRDALFEIEGGWTFNEPAGSVEASGTSATTAEPATETAASDLPVTDPSHPDYDARVLHTLQPSKNGNGTAIGAATSEATNHEESNVKTNGKGKSKAKAAGKAKGKTKAAPKAAKGPKVAKTNRKTGPNTGKTAKFIAECKARWTSAPDVMERYGWTSNTLRGVLGHNKIKHKEDFERKKIDGVTHYRIAA